MTPSRQYFARVSVGLDPPDAHGSRRSEEIAEALMAAAEVATIRVDETGMSIIYSVDVEGATAEKAAKAALRPAERVADTLALSYSMRWVDVWQSDPAQTQAPYGKSLVLHVGPIATGDGIGEPQRPLQGGDAADKREPDPGSG